MDLRSLPPDLSSLARVSERRRRIEEEFHVDLAPLTVGSTQLGHSEERNCENMFGAVPIPVGLAGPLTFTLSTGEETTVHLPLATTEGALVASVNRGCKALTLAGGVRTSSTYHGVTRSIAFGIRDSGFGMRNWIVDHASEWKSIGEATSGHLKILSYDIDERDALLFLTIAADTDEAMGMNMVTIAAQAIGEWIAAASGDECGLRLITVAGNVDSDKKPSVRTHTRGRGYEATAVCILPTAIIHDVLKTTPEALLEVADAKLRVGSAIAGAIGSNLHAANIIAALYLATGQDAAHVVEGSMADTMVGAGAGARVDGVQVSVRIPALLLGIRGGGTTLPAQSRCLEILLQSRMKNEECRMQNKSRGMSNQELVLRDYSGQATSNDNLEKEEITIPRRFAETIAAAVLAGEVSLLAAQASNTLAKAHTKLGRASKI